MNGLVKNNVHQPEGNGKVWKGRPYKDKCWSTSRIKLIVPYHKLQPSYLSGLETDTIVHRDMNPSDCVALDCDVMNNKMFFSIECLYFSSEDLLFNETIKITTFD